jgi:hypothetical protein
MVQPFLRRAIKKIGNWHENQNNFHVLFDTADIDCKVKANQFYNHFPENREFTTKAGLCKNLWTLSFQESQLRIS